jgi:hypothetical protein
LHMDAQGIWAAYQQGLVYQRQMGFSENWPLFARMKSGRQWAPPTERTRNLPRPVFNIIEQFIGVKTAELLRRPVRLVYGGGGDADAMTEKAARIWDDIDQDELCADFLEDAATYGTGILHYYRHPQSGRIRGEVLSPQSVFFAAPEVREVQHQPAILIATDLPTERLRAEAIAAGATAQQLEDIRPNRQAPGGPVTTLITRYSRREGQVVFTRSTESFVLTRSAPLGESVSLYPIELFCWRKRRDSIFGTGEVESILPNQRAINFVVAMLLLSVQQTAWPRLVVKEGALRQLPTNAPGEVLTDHCPEGSGIRYLEPPAYPAQALAAVDKVYELTRATSGVTDVMSGEPFSRSASAQAISALQMQAKAPLDATRLRYYRSLSNIGKIWAQLLGQTGEGGPLSCTAKEENHD